MFVQNLSLWAKLALRRHLNSVCVVIVATSTLLTGCGGGGGSATGGATASAPDPMYADSRSSLPSAVAHSFTPNYTPTVESSGIWQGRTLRVYFSAESETVVTAALLRWEDATAGFFRWECVSSLNEAQVTFSAVLVSEFAADVVGRTHYTYDAERNALTSAKVDYAVTGMDDDQTRVVVHELGHVLGIHGHSDSEADVMYPIVDLRDVITERDLNTLFWLYRDTGNVTTTTNRATGHEVTRTITCGELRD